MKKTLIVSCGLIILVASAIWTSKVNAFPTYSEARNATNCRGCHGDFRAPGYMSFKDGTSWGIDLMNGHLINMLGGSTCFACHSSGGFFPVSLGSSSDSTLSMSCVGCHGRSDDAGNDSISAGVGAGLRQHHNNIGIATCAGCHSDANPTNYTPVGEDVIPPNYGQPNVITPMDPCDADGSESVFGSTGLDNDGDLLDDGDDPDCVTNNPPVAPDDAYSTDQDTPLNVAAPGVLANDSDADGDPLTAVLITDVSNGALTLNSDGSFSYDPDPGFFGIDSFTYVANDGLDDSNVATVTITVNIVANNPPIADPNGPYSGTVGQPVQFDGSGSFDPDGTIIFYDWDFGDSSPGTGVIPTHAYAAPGTYIVSLTVTDDGGATDTSTTTATINDEAVLCEGDFDCNGAVDATDVATFLADFGRSVFNNPCNSANQCNGDFDCDGSVAANDVAVFLADFGRSQFNNPCPPCEVGPWCNNCEGKECGTYTFDCNPNVPCICSRTAEGSGVCIDSVFCTNPTCITSADCGPNEVCIVDTCCPTPICAPNVCTDGFG
jgi:hypothetical protein